MRTARVLLAKVPKAQATEVIARLHREGRMDRSGRIIRDDRWVMVPVIAPVPGFETEEGIVPMKELRDPHQVIDALTEVPDELRHLLPRRWEFIGNIALIRLPTALDPYREHIGQVYSSALGASTVVRDVSGISGELRTPDMEVLFGHDTIGEKLENGIRYRLDVTKVMFSSGNIDERERMGHLDCTGETVVDMFAGIGYFSLPLAVHGHARRVIACEKNPDSYHHLMENIALNDVTDIVEPVLGDNRDLMLDAPADRVVMGYVCGTARFLEKGVSLVRPGGMIHFHDTFHSLGAREEAEEAIAQACGVRGHHAIGSRVVKSYAPGVDHVVVDFIVPG